MPAQPRKGQRWSTDRATLPDEGATGASPDGSQIAVIGKAAQVLEALLQRPEGAAPTQLAVDLAINRSTAFRLLTSLERSRLVDRDPETGRYRLGLRFLTFGDAVRARIDVVSIADPVLRQLRDEVRLTVYLSIRNEWGAVCLKRLAGPEFDVLAWKPGSDYLFIAEPDPAPCWRRCRTPSWRPTSRSRWTEQLDPGADGRPGAADGGHHPRAGMVAERGGPHAGCLVRRRCFAGHQRVRAVRDFGGRAWPPDFRAAASMTRRTR